jgi:hypothetical protein
MRGKPDDDKRLTDPVSFIILHHLLTVSKQALRLIPERFWLDHRRYDILKK